MNAEKAIEKYGAALYVAEAIRMKHEYLTTNNLQDTEENGRHYSGGELLNFIISCNRRKLRHLCEIADSLAEGVFQPIH
jgi:hypothetical protein